VYILRYREKGVRRRETRDIYRRHQPRLQPAVSDPCIYVTMRVTDVHDVAGLIHGHGCRG